MPISAITMPRRAHPDTGPRAWAPSTNLGMRDIFGWRPAVERSGPLDLTGRLCLSGRMELRGVAFL